MDNEKAYHNSIRQRLINSRLTTVLSAAFRSSADGFFSRAMRWSSIVFLLRFFCLRRRSLSVRPVSSSSCKSSSLKLSRGSSLDASSAEAPSSKIRGDAGRLMDWEWWFGVRREGARGRPGAPRPPWVTGFIRLLLRRRWPRMGSISMSSPPAGPGSREEDTEADGPADTVRTSEE